MFTGNDNTGATSGINVQVAAGVVVSAVGNDFVPGVQGADGAGRYHLGAAPCGPSSCDVTSGAGLNYHVASGALRVAQ